MTAGLIYVVCSVSVIMLVGLCVFCYLLGKGNENWSSALAISLVVAALGGVLPGALWHEHCERVELAESLFQEYCEGRFLDWQHEEVDGFRYRWVDSAGRLQEVILFENPWGEPVKVELK